VIWMDFADWKAVLHFSRTTQEVAARRSCALDVPLRRGAFATTADEISAVRPKLVERSGQLGQPGPG
jgi:hypothetical protein